MKKNALIRYGIFFLFLLGYSSLFAQNSIDELWKKAEAALEANEEYAAVANLEKIVMSTGLFDEPAIQSRLVLAELSLMGTDMEKIYESYAYFNCLHQTQDPHHRYGDLTRQLKHRYDSLLQVDMSQGITPGFYFSDSHDDRHVPTMLARIERTSDRWTISLCYGCGIINDPVNRKKGNIFCAADINYTEDNQLVAVWNGHVKQRLPQTDLAHSMADQSREFKASMYQEMAAGNYSTSDVVTGTIATEFVGALVNGLGSAMARGKTTQYFHEMIWHRNSDGSLGVLFNRGKVTGYTGQDIRVQNDEVRFNLYKLYPHHQIFFFDYEDNSLITCNGRIMPTWSDYDRFFRFSPVFFNPSVQESFGITQPSRIEKLHKRKDINGIMYKVFEYYTLFADMHTDTIAKYIPPFAELESVYIDEGESNRGLCLGKVYKSSLVDFYAMQVNQALVFTGLPQNLLQGTCYQSVYYDDGSHLFAEVVNGSQQGYFQILLSNGNRYVGEAIKCIASGEGTLYYHDGKILKGNFDNQVCLSGVLTFEYNGVRYQEEVHDFNWVNGVDTWMNDWINKTQKQTVTHSKTKGK